MYIVCQVKYILFTSDFD